MKRPLLKLLALVAVLVVAGLFVLAGTTPGLRLALQVADRFVPGELSAVGLRGSLAAGARAEALVYRDGGIHIELRALVFRWRPLRLFNRTLHIRRFAADGLSVRLPEGPGPAAEAESARPPFQGIRLPLRVELDQANIGEVRIHRPDRAPLALGSVTLAATLEAQRLELQALEVRAPGGRLAVEGRLGLAPAAAVALRTRWSLEPRGFAPVAGEGTVGGTLAQLELNQAVAAPARLTVDAQIGLLTPRPTWSAAVDVQSLPLEKVHPGWRAVHLAGDLRLRGDLNSLEMDGRMGVQDPALGSWDTRVSVEGGPGDWTLRRLHADAVEGSTRLEGRGRWQGGPVQGAGELRLRWQDLRWPLAGRARFASTAGELQWRGTPDNYELRLAGDVAAADAPGGRVRIDGRGTAQQLSVESLTADWLEGRLVGTGMLRWRPRLSWSAALRARDVNPGAFWPQWRGQINADVSLGGEGRPQLALQGQVDRLWGTLRGQPLEASARFDATESMVNVSRLNLRSGSARLSVHGTLAERWDLAWNVKAPQLGDLVPDARGGLELEGQATGAPPALDVAATVDGANLAYRDYAAESVKGSVQVDLDDAKPSAIRFLATNVQLPRLALERVRLDGEGRASDHRLTLEATAGQQRSLALAAAGGLSGQGWSGRIEQGHLAAPVLGGRWSLAAPFALEVGTARALLARSCWTRAEATACAVGRWAPGPTGAVDVELRQLPLELLAPLLPADSGLDLAGVIDGSAHVRADEGRLTAARAQVRSAGGVLRYTLAQEARQTTYREARVSVEADEAGLRALALLDLDAAGRVQGELGLPRWRPGAMAEVDQPVGGSVRIELNSLELVPVVVPALQRVEGNVKARIDIAGQLNQPRLSGEGRVRGEVAVPLLGLELKDMDLALAGAPDGTLRVDGSVRSGPGQLTVEGELHPRGLDDWRARVHAEGAQVEVVRLPKAHVLADPDFSVDVTPTVVRLDGAVHIPKADIELPEPSEAVSASPDVALVGGRHEERDASRWQARGRLKLTLGDAVRVSGYGFRGRVGGQLTLIEGDQAVTTAQGELRVEEGEYKAYGQELNVRRGRLLYAGGPVDNPGLDLEAVREVGDVTAGLSVTGTLQSPALSLFSTPAMDDANVLSYLLTGRPLGQASATEGQLLVSAAASLAGSELLGANIAQTLGLHEVSIERGTSAQDTALVLGTYLSPRLYVRYTTSLVEDAAVLRVRYQLSSKWTLESQTGAQTGADLLYTIER